MKNVVFDIGWVLVHLDYRPLFGLLESRGVTHDGLEDLTGRIALQEHESGRLDGHGLLDNIVALAPQRVTHAEAEAAWNGMFEPQPGMYELAARLEGRYRVYLLSNVGDLHWARLHADYGIGAVGHGALASFHAGVMKPDPAIYAQAEQRFSLEPAATVFIDDRADNVDAARDVGINAVVVRGVDAARAAIAALR